MSPHRTGHALFALAALAAALLAGCATTGSVKGNVTVPDAKAASSDAVITAFLEGKTEPVPHASGRATIVEADGRFTPNVMLVEPGTTVHFENHDKIYHNVFSVSPANKFDLGSVAPGHEREVRLENAGTVTVYCELHPREVAYIVVAPRRSSTRVQDGGGYLLGGLAPGKYSVRAWHPTFGSQTRHIDLPPRGLVTVNFRY